MSFQSPNRFDSAQEPTRVKTPDNKTEIAQPINEGSRLHSAEERCKVRNPNETTQIPTEIYDARKLKRMLKQIYLND